MNDVRKIGIRAIPDDADIAKFLARTIQEYQYKFNIERQALKDTVEQTIRDNEPPIFAVGKMLNYLASLEKPELIEILAGAMWSLEWGDMNGS